MPNDTSAGETATLDPTDMMTITKFIAASPEAVFDAWTDPEAVMQWMEHGATKVPEASFDVRQKLDLRF